MTPAYRVLIDLDALTSLPRTGKRRSAVLCMIAGLAHNADQGGDFEVTDPETFRPFQVSCIAGFAITWWIDHPVLEVKIIDIRETFRP
ncbi:MAG: hypothetical protein V4727_06310 [Verrucomicrobiota bacterium]